VYYDFQVPVCEHAGTIIFTIKRLEAVPCEENLATLMNMNCK
jgi:hypothetical protein